MGADIVFYFYFWDWFFSLSFVIGTLIKTQNAIKRETRQQWLHNMPQ